MKKVIGESEEERTGGTGGRELKTSKLWYVHVATRLDGCKLHELQTCTNKIK